MEKAQHTQGEWGINNWAQPDREIRIGAIGTPLICTVEMRDVSVNEHKANAERIVKCVNAHDELVAALKAFDDFADRVMDPADYVSAMRRNAKEILNKVGAFEK